MAKTRSSTKHTASGGKSKGRRKGLSSPRPRGERAENDEFLDPDPAKPADVIKRRVRRPLMDFAGILSPEAAEDLRDAIEEARKEREPLDRERLKRLMEAFDRLDDTVVLETTRRKAKAAGLTRKKARDLLDEVKKEAWDRTYGDKRSRK
jgi:hypothetical protein